MGRPNQTRTIVRIIIINEQFEMLLGRQRDRQQWHFPGGVIFPKEKPEAAALRELKEETRLRKRKIQRIHTEMLNWLPRPEKIYCFAGKAPRRSKIIPDGKEIDALAWVTIQESKNLPLTDTTLLLLKNLALIKLFVE
jgi:8-oxo-dGTP pyrophosphatase MutT (NUDIX family)